MLGNPVHHLLKENSNRNFTTELHLVLNWEKLVLLWNQYVNPSARAEIL